MKTRTGKLRARLARAVLAAAAIQAPMAAPAPAQIAGDTVTSTFTKEAVAIRPGGATPVFGQVVVGQRIDYVLSAMAQGPNGVPASGILDVLSPNQSYVPGSLQLPPGWTASPNPPYSVNNTTVYSAPAGASLLSFQLPVGGSALGPTGQGNGLYPIPGAANGNVYAFSHHVHVGGQVDCWLETSLARCPGFPKPNSAGGATSGVGTVYNFNGAVVQQRYIYYAAYRTVAGTAFGGLACWDTAVDQPCPFHQLGGPLGTVTVNNWLYWARASSQVAGALVVPGTNRVLIAVQNFLYCFDKSGGPTSTVPCANWTATGFMTAPGPHTASQMAHVMDLVFEIGPNPSRVYVSVGGNADRVQCVTLGMTSPPGFCTGTWGLVPKAAVDAGVTPNNYPQKGFDLHPIPSWNGSHLAVCLYSVDGRVLTLPGSAAPACWDPGGNAVTPGAMPGFPLCPVAICTGYTSMNLGSAAGANRVVFARWNNGPLCVEMNAGLPPAVCSPWGSGLPTSKWDYGFAPDPLAPDRCVLVLGEADQIYRFDGRDGSLGCPVTYRTTGDPMDFFCQKEPAQLSWSRIVIRNRPAVPQLTGGTIVVRNAATQAVLQTIAVTASNVYSIASIPYAANHKLTVEFTPIYSSGGPVATYFLEVQFTASEAPQICYQARVDRCGEIFNRATYGPLASPAPPLGTTGPVPSPWTASASVGLGDALAAPCDSCPPRRDSLDLSIRKTAFYPPWTVGTMGEYQIVTTVELGTLDPSTAPTPTFTDNLPAGLTFHSYTGAPDWTCVATGQQVACTYHGQAVAAGHPLPPVTIAVNVVGPLAGGAVVNCAVLGPDANLENNRSCVEATIRPCRVEYDLAIRKEFTGGFWKMGTTRQFVIRAEVMQGSLNPATAATPTWIDNLPAGVTYVSATGIGWACSAAGQQVSCTYQGLAAMAGPALLPPVTLTVNLTAAGPIQNCAVVPVTDLNLANNRSCVNVDVGK